MTCVLECESRHVLSIGRGIGDSQAMLAFMEAECRPEFLNRTHGDQQRPQFEEALQAAKRRGCTTTRGRDHVGAAAVSSAYLPRASRSRVGAPRNKAPQQPKEKGSTKFWRIL